MWMGARWLIHSFQSSFRRHWLPHLARLVGIEKLVEYVDHWLGRQNGIEWLKMNGMNVFFFGILIIQKLLRLPSRSACNFNCRLISRSLAALGPVRDASRLSTPLWKARITRIWKKRMDYKFMKFYWYLKIFQKNKFKNFKRHTAHLLEGENY